MNKSCLNFKKIVFIETKQFKLVSGNISNFTEIWKYFKIPSRYPAAQIGFRFGGGEVL